MYVHGNIESASHNDVQGKQNIERHKRDRSVKDALMHIGRVLVVPDNFVKQIAGDRKDNRHIGYHQDTGNPTVNHVSNTNVELLEHLIGSVELQRTTPRHGVHGPQV